MWCSDPMTRKEEKKRKDDAKILDTKGDLHVTYKIMYCLFFKVAVESLNLTLNFFSNQSLFLLIF